MSEKVTYTEPKTMDTSHIQWHVIKEYFKDIEAAINQHKLDIEALGRHQTQTISYAVEDGLEHTVLSSGKHLRSRITNAYVTLGDNVPVETIVEIVGITEPIKFGDNEKMGKVRIFKLKRNHIHFVDDVKVKQTANRRVVFTFTLESDEGED